MAWANTGIRDSSFLAMNRSETGSVANIAQMSNIDWWLLTKIWAPPGCTCSRPTTSTFTPAAHNTARDQFLCTQS
ncbi:MAG: hypothetical protein P8Y21_00785 [Gemmatimonadales bacterium]